MWNLTELQAGLKGLRGMDWPPSYRKSFMCNHTILGKALQAINNPCKTAVDVCRQQVERCLLKEAWFNGLSTGLYLRISCLCLVTLTVIASLSFDRSDALYVLLFTLSEIGYQVLLSF